MRFYALLVFLQFLLYCGSVHAHTRMKAANGFVPRSNSDGLKSGPCGGVPRTSTPAVYQPGQTITVNWEETINHPGRYEFYFSPANDANWTLLKVVNDTQDNPATVPHQYTTTLTLPATPCSACTLQLIQVMTENPAAPSLYYSCADIRIQSGSPATPPGPTPLPCE